MKKIVNLILFVSVIATAQNNQFKKSLSGVDKVVLSSDTRIELVAGTASEIIIENRSSSTKKHNHWHKDDAAKKDKRKGLVAVYAGGKDDTNGFGFSINKEGKILYVSDLKSRFQRRGLKITLPKNINISVDAGNLGSIEMEGFTGEVEASANVGKIQMKNVTGPITVDANVGKVDIDFDKVSQKSPITISTSVAEIDVALPANTKANLELKTQGTVYTNFDFEMPTKKGMKNVSGRKTIVSKINNGGVKIYIKSSMGNIYLRKK